MQTQNNFNLSPLGWLVIGVIVFLIWEPILICAIIGLIGSVLYHYRFMIKNGFIRFWYWVTH